MWDTYKDWLSIDRIDNNWNYNKDNCKWATIKEQWNNKRNNHYILYNGENKTMMEWSEIFNIPYSRLRARIRRWWNIDKIFSDTKFINQFK